ncbi:hypothetical protein ACFPES_02675 [Paenibacillus sp. GCM10023248]|uniref:hypothetical protein n=1 Tax=unclassified Paenibacillus TaxID=185978 RepID=UPI002377F1BD|nr:hypothetical protein [Paenibacillus sp. MAHUQ-63]MDD9265930.1 hypothetical protein [Paenibacillus sp. MAHUQ-63]
MRKSKWTKWQFGIGIGVLLFYLFQEVQESPQFQEAVVAAASAKSAPVVAQKEASPNTNRIQPNGERRGRNHSRIAGGMADSGSGSGSSSSSGSSSGSSSSSSQSQLTPHARSHAS